MRIGRRDVILSGLGLGIAFAAGPRLERANWAGSSTFGLTPLGGAVDQTAMLQQAIDAAAKAGSPLFLPPGVYSTRRLEFRSGTHLTGVPGKSIAGACRSQQRRRAGRDRGHRSTGHRDHFSQRRHWPLQRPRDTRRAEPRDPRERRGHERGRLAGPRRRQQRRRLRRRRPPAGVNVQKQITEERLRAGTSIGPG